MPQTFIQVWFGELQHIAKPVTAVPRLSYHATTDPLEMDHAFASEECPEIGCNVFRCFQHSSDIYIIFSILFCNYSIFLLALQILFFWIQLSMQLSIVFFSILFSLLFYSLYYFLLFYTLLISTLYTVFSILTLYILYSSFLFFFLSFFSLFLFSSVASLASEAWLHWLRMRQLRRLHVPQRCTHRECPGPRWPASCAMASEQVPAGWMLPSLWRGCGLPLRKLRTSLSMSRCEMPLLKKRFMSSLEAKVL